MSAVAFYLIYLLGERLMELERSVASAVEGAINIMAFLAVTGLWAALMNAIWSKAA